MATERTDSMAARVVAPPPVHRASFGQLWQIPALVAGVLAVFGVWVSRPLWYDPDAWQFRRDLTHARRMLEDRHASANGALACAADALKRIDRFPRRAGEAHFLLGSAYLRLSDQVPADRAVETRQQARFHLEQSQALGVPETDRVRLMYRLGKVWYQTGGDLKQAANCLAQSVEEGADDRFEGYGVLAQVFVLLNNIPAALQANENQLQFPTEDENLLAGPRLLRGELLLRSPGAEAREAARKVLKKIGPDASPVILARARLLMAQSYQEDGAWDQAAPLWEAVLADPRETPLDPGRIWYWLGCCYQNLGNVTKAMHAWQQAIPLGRDEAQAASLRLGDAQLGACNEALAKESFQRALASVDTPVDYHNGLLGLAQARALVQSGCQTAMKKGSFETARDLAQLYAKLADPAAARNFMGEVAEVWGQACRNRANQEKTKEAAALQEEAARQHFAEAGAAYEAVAGMATDKDSKSSQLWRAADAYLQAQEFTHAVGILEQFVRLESPVGDRLGEAWYRLGEAHQALGHDSAAASSFLRCIENPSRFAYLARYQLAILKERSEEGGKGRPEAIQILQQNLELIRTDPDRDRDAQEKSLYELADLLYLSGNYRLAAESWEQALTIYPNNPFALESRWRLGDCYRSLANEEQQSQPFNTPLEREARPHFHRQYTMWLEKAASNFQKVVDYLEARRAAGTLKEEEAALLLKALFSLADTQFYLGQYEAASYRYDTLASRYQQQYEGLVALKELYNCHVLHLQDPKHLDLALATLDRLRVTLHNLPDSILRDRPLAQTQAAWEKWIKDQEEELKKIRPPGTPSSPAEVSKDK